MQAQPTNLDSSERYVRQEMLERYSGKLSSLANMRLGVIGVGGLGGLCSLLLANAGVGSLRLADADTVAIHNLHRQLLFTSQQIGLSKAECAVGTIQERAAVKVESFPYKVDVNNFDEFAQDLDLILDLSDDSVSRLTISKLCLKRQLNLFSGAVSGYTALFALFEYADPAFVEKYGCYQCLTSGSNINTKVGITGPQAACAASLSAHLVLEFLVGNRSAIGKLIRMDLNSLSMFKLTLQRDEHCPICNS